MRSALIAFPGLLGIALAGCDAPPPRPLLDRQCVTVGGGEPATLEIRSPSRGVARVAIEPQGIAVVASIPTRSGMTDRATSPVDRLGPIALVSEARTGRNIPLRVESRDWPGIRAEVCVNADLIPRSNLARVRAERAFARASAATHDRDWQRAFEGYEAAARAFDELGLNASSGAARHAMAELAYQRLRREGEAVPLARQALNSYGKEASVAIRGALAALEARSAVEVRDVSTDAARKEVAAMIDAAGRLLSDSSIGAREALRLTVLEGFLAYRTDSSQRAEQLFLTAMDACSRAGDWECHGIAAQNIAALAEERKSFAVALQTYEEARRHVDPRIAPELAADLLDNLGRLQRAAGLVSASEVSLASASNLYARLGNCDSLRRTLGRIGALHAQVGSFDDATSELQRAVSLECGRLLASVGERRPEMAPDVTPRAGLCTTLLDEGQLSPDGKTAVLEAMLTLQEALLLSGDLDGAHRCTTQLQRYATASRGRVRAANATGALSLERGRFGDALAAFERARKIADDARFPPEYLLRGRTLLGLARARLRTGDPNDANVIALQALRASSARMDVSQTVESLQILAAGLRMIGQSPEASRTLRMAIELIERVPIDELDGDVRATYLAAQHGVFADLTELLASTAQDEGAFWEAFGAAEAGRARSYRYALSQTRARQNTRSPGADHMGDDELIHRVWKEFSAPATEDMSALLRGLREMQTGKSTLFGPSDRAALQRRLSRIDSVLVQYASGPRSMFAFVVQPGSIRLVRLGERDEIASAATRLAEQLRARAVSPSQIAASAKDLARQVWWPLASAVSRKRVLIAADDALHFVPFSMLPWSSATGEQLLVHRVEVVNVPSASFVTNSLEVGNRRSGTRDIALIGDPVFRPSQWQRECRASANVVPGRLERESWTEWLPSLPASREEVLAIARLARAARPAGQVDVLLGCAATPDALKRAASEGRSVLHIATHGRIDARRPRLSALALSPIGDRPEDGSFALLDILDLDLDARLVTLSACDTSNGRLLRGEGVLGPAQAFLQSGASSVVASYWRVEDETTARFMRALYERLLDDNMSIAEALRRTQLAQQTLGPSYSWAAFGLYGRPDTRI